MTGVIYGTYLEVLMMILKLTITMMDWFHGKGYFGRWKWVTDTYLVFVQGFVANQGFQRVDFFRYAPNDPMHKSEKNILGGTIKAGANYNIDAKNNVYVNAGYYSSSNCCFPRL